MSGALLLILCLSAPGRAQIYRPFGISEDLRDALANASSATVRAAWVRLPTSLLLYDSSGTLVQEVGLSQWQDEIGGIPRRHTVRGGSSKDGRFAWSWEKVETIPPPGKPGTVPAPAEQSRTLSYLGTDGQELWRDALADAPAGLEPAVQSANGELALVLERGPDGWTAVVFDFLGNRLLATRSPGAVEFAELSPQGRYGLVRWHPGNLAPVYGYLDLSNKARRFLKLTNVPPAPLRIDDNGRVFAGDKEIFKP